MLSTLEVEVPLSTQPISMSTQQMTLTAQPMTLSAQQLALSGQHPVISFDPSLVDEGGFLPEDAYPVMPLIAHHNNIHNICNGKGNTYKGQNRGMFLFIDLSSCHRKRPLIEFRTLVLQYTCWDY